MPLSLSEVGGLARSPAFLARVHAAVARVASHVGRDTASTQEHYVLRRDLARDFSRWMDDVVQGMAWMVAAQPDVTADIDDGTLVGLVLELWDAAAGAGASWSPSAFDEASA